MTYCQYGKAGDALFEMYIAGRRKDDQQACFSRSAYSNGIIRSSPDATTPVDMWTCIQNTGETGES
jgi:hypothetical protein